MKAKTFVTDGDREYQRYEAVMAWHPEKKCLYEVSFAFDGSVSEYRVDPKDRDTLHVASSRFREASRPNVRQIITFLDNDSYRWVILLKQGEEWKQIMDATLEAEEVGGRLLRTASRGLRSSRPRRNPNPEAGVMEFSLQFSGRTLTISLRLF